jgi:hypothetical protein
MDGSPLHYKHRCASRWNQDFHNLLRMGLLFWLLTQNIFVPNDLSIICHGGQGSATLQGMDDPSFSPPPLLLPSQLYNQATATLLNQSIKFT